MENIEFYKSFPLLVPESLYPELKAEGYLDIPNGARVRISIDTSNGAYSVDAIHSTKEIEEILKGRRNELNKRFQQCTTALSFVKEIEHTLADACTEKKKLQHGSRFYKQIVEECDIIGWDNVDCFDKDEQTMTIKLRDGADRQHSVVVNFETNMFSSDIESTPVSMESIGLEGYLDRLEQKSKQLAASWDLLDEVDATLCVLQPQRARRHELWRRIAVSDVCTAMLEAMPERTQPPTITIYGPHSQARELNQRIKAHRHLWKAGDPVRVNLERVLQITLPERHAGSALRF
ncbi:hypothetical protein EV183_001564 [Coemansia sp. RSA 2336]|nr:hypothetical protein EV183_001564 [Coemansia sp. RSA 2336]